MKVLLIDDDVAIYKLLKTFINPLVSLNWLSALPKDSRELKDYSLIILDLWLEEGKNSLGFLTEIRESSPEILDRIILLTGSGTVENEIESHRLGLRDYVKKPFDPRVFSALLDKHLSSSKKFMSEIKFGPFRMDLASFKVYLEGSSEKLELTHTEFKILKLIIESRGRIVTRERLMNEVWDMNEETQTRTVDMHISTLRKKLGSGGDYLKTKRGVGYYIEDE